MGVKDVSHFVCLSQRKNGGDRGERSRSGGNQEVSCSYAWFGGPFRHPAGVVTLSVGA